MKHEGGQDGKVTSYGLTLSEMESLKSDQGLGAVEMINAVNAIKQTGDHKHKLIEDIAKGYQVPVVEFKQVFHVILENPLFNEGSGERVDRGPVVQKFSKAAFKLADDNGGFMAKIAIILHNPIRAVELANNPQDVNGDFEREEKEEENAKLLSVEAEIKAEELANENESLKQELQKMKEEKEATLTVSGDEILSAKNVEKNPGDELTEEDLEKILAEEESNEKGKEAKNV